MRSLPQNMERKNKMSQIIASTYELIEKIGAGGGGTVYLANHLRLGKRVVLKADKRAITTRPDLLRREVDILKNLSHPHIPQVYDFFVEHDTVYTVMDFIEGESLDRPLKRGEKYPQPQVVKWAKQLLDALCYLHSPVHGNPPRGYVHSDIKPANLMRTPDNNICLIDFNIALALGEENVVGCSAGYASPEHYGLDFSTDGDTETFMRYSDDDTETMTDNLGRGFGSSSKMRAVVPDIRSDIYSVGATLYHLLSGKRPAKNAKEVKPLSEEEFSLQIVEIISKAMNPNPNLRYQTAEDMLDAFLHLHENDPRTRIWKRNRKMVAVSFAVCFTVGVVTSFTGLKRMQITENRLKLAEYSGNALEEGDTEGAVEYALQALETEQRIWEPECPAEAQKALTDALGVYDLADGYKSYETVEFSAAPLCMAISPDGKTACCICDDSLAVFDTESARILELLPAEESALSEAKFVDNHRLIYAGRDGVQVYDVKDGKVMWTGMPATSISVSDDGKTAAAIYKDEKSAVIYQIDGGRVLYTVDFGEKHQQVTVNDRFANPHDNLLALNREGNLLGVSFSDGSLQIYDLENTENNMQLLPADSGYTHFEGGFCGTYFAFSASDQKESVFAVVDTPHAVQTGGFESDGSFSVQADEEGIFLKSSNILVRIDPVTGNQIPLVTMNETIDSFARSSTHTFVSSESEILFFDETAELTSSHKKEGKSNFLQIAEGTALVGSSDSPVVRILKYENHPEAELFSYDSSYEHKEARVSADGTSVMLFSYKQFRVYGMDGELKADVLIPDAEQVYDQQYIRNEKGTYLEVIYNNGRILTYDGLNGQLLSEKMGEQPDLTLYEEFYTDKYRMESPLHGTPAVYDQGTGKLVRELEKDDYLTYVTEIDDYIIVQYMTADGYCYGQLLNAKCEVLAELPYLSDVIDDMLVFDYPTGNMRESRIYNKEELLTIASNKDEGE